MIADGGPCVRSDPDRLIHVTSSRGPVIHAMLRMLRVGRSRRAELDSRVRQRFKTS
jgi:hypothetical protein